MKITKLVVNGELQENPAASPGKMLTLKKSINVSGANRGQARPLDLKLEDNDLVELVYDDDTSWLCPPDTLEDLYPGSFTAQRSGDASFSIPVDLEATGPSRGVIGKAVLKTINLFGRKLVREKIADLARDLEDKQLGKMKGLVHVNRSFDLERMGPKRQIDIGKPVLLFIHGTNSSTAGSFGEMVATELWNHILGSYDGNNILGFQHATLTKSPLQNALELARQVPAGAELHIITHSRGGLIGEILCRLSGTTGPDAGFCQNEIEFFKTEGRARDAEVIGRLKAEFALKKIRVTKFIRVACPAAGTTILSKRLDHFFNISLNLIGALTGGLANPAYQAMKNLLVAAIDQKNDYDVLPGVEAMKPDSPFITVLNNQASSVSIHAQVIAISGNCKPKFNVKALVIIASRLFYLEDNDLVVNTKSMYSGSKRMEKLHYFFDEGNDVDHFRYFRNRKSTEAIRLALKSPGVSVINGFSEHTRGTLGEAERNAVLKLEGGQYSTGEPTGQRPILIMLPGIMGSNLTCDFDLIWINYLRFLTGGLKRIGINADGVTAPSLVKTSYKKLGEALGFEYDVVTFSFDWRLSLEQAAEEFEGLIRELLKLGQRIKIIGHSMGGVLVRDFMVFHAETWQRLNRSEGFRLLFLGSPLGGSFRIINVLFGQDDIIGKLGKLDIIHSKRGLLRIFSRFPGLLCLLPHGKDPGNDFSKPSVWKNMAAAFGDPDWPLPGDADLARFEEYRDKILTSKSIDFSNAVYIAGQDKQTPCGYRIDSTVRGPELVFLSTAEGDQSVTWESGIPKSMIDDGRVYYASHSHGALSNAPALFPAIREILAKGSTHLLSRNRPVLRGDQRLFKRVEISDFDLSPDGIEKTILGIGDEPSEPVSELPVKVRVSHGDLKYATYPVFAGHFKGDSVLYAERRIDGLLGGVLQERHKLGLYPGEIGTSEILLRSDAGFPGAVIIGLGQPDHLTAFELARSMEQAASRYLLAINGKGKTGISMDSGKTGLSTLIIGCGYGGLSIESSVNAILQGVANANNKLKSLHGESGKGVEEVEFIELYEDKALNCFYSVQRLAGESAGTLNITTENERPSRLGGARRQMAAEAGSDWWHRFTITRELNKKGEINGMRFSISTGAAREEFRTLFTSTGVVEQLVETISTDNNWTPEKARAIFELLIPNDFKSRLKKQGNITWVLDKYTARFPWELLQDKTRDARPLCINAGMIRQLTTGDSRINIEPVTGNTALVIGDPDLKGFITQLPGALEEAKGVAQLLREKGFETTALLRESQETIVPALMSADYKIIHIACHGVFDPDPEKPSGVVIGKNSYLSTAEIAQMSSTPELVFVNCCFLGRTDGLSEDFFQSRFRLAANIGTQLIEIGVKAVVVAGWAVDDAAALLFAQKFYDCLFEGSTFGMAVREAREAAFNLYRSKNTWGAYQCYGDPHYRLREGISAVGSRRYLVSTQAEIDLGNLLSDLRTGDADLNYAADKLKKISEEVDRQGIRVPSITEAEALIYVDLGDYKNATAKFEALLSSDDSSYSFKSIEQFCNIRVKHLIGALDEMDHEPAAALESQFATVMADLDALLHLSPTAERFNLKGSAYKRRIRLYSKNNHSSVRQAVIESARNYYYAYTRASGVRKWYSMTNWLTLEVILVLADKKDRGNKKKREWGNPVYDGGRSAIYELPALEELRASLKELETYFSKAQPDRGYWDQLAIPNIRLCEWMLDASSGKPARVADPRRVRESYLKVWKMVGSVNEKRSEIQHLDLLIMAMSALIPGHGLLNGTKTLRDKLNLAIGG